MVNSPNPSVVTYPAEDGVPLGETADHSNAADDFLDQAAELFDGRDDVAVEANRFVYWVEGDPTERVNPDVFICIGRPPVSRDVWKTWEEGGRFADLVVEFSSKSTRTNDLGNKKATYEMLGVREYVIFDPRREWVKEGLRAWRLVDGEFRPLVIQDGRLWLGTLGAHLALEGKRVRIVRADGVAMLHPEERRARLAAAEAAKARAEAENAALRARIAELERRR